MAKVGRKPKERKPKPSGPTIIAPQPGPQTDFLSCSADIAIYGGSAGGGKTFSAVLLPLQHVELARFGAVIFRQSFKMITEEGGLWGESEGLYRALGAVGKIGNLDWIFPSGGRVGFAYLGSDADKIKYQGSQIPLIIFDELTHFSETSFFYMLSRNRSTCGVRPYVRATTNPDAESWVAKFIDWWLDEEGYAIPERSGVIRWFVRVNGEVIWADDADTLEQKYDQMPKSFTFIRSSLFDNKILLSADPGYLANLQALHPVDRARLLDGNWKIKDEAGKVFTRDWFQVVEEADMLAAMQSSNGDWAEVRFWDLAATEKDFGKDPCATAGVKIRRVGTTYFVLDAHEVYLSPGATNDAIVNTASQDGRYCQVRWEVEPGSSGIRDNYALMNLLGTYDAIGMSPEANKVMRSKPLATAAYRGNVKLVRGDWNNRFLNAVIGFPEKKDGRDIVDAASGAYAAMSGDTGVYKETKVKWI